MIRIVNKLSQYLAVYTELIRLGDKSMYEAKDAERNSFIINELD